MSFSSISEVNNLTAIFLCGCVCFSFTSQREPLKERIEWVANEKLLYNNNNYYLLAKVVMSQNMIHISLL